MFEDDQDLKELHYPEDEDEEQFDPDWDDEENWF